MKKMSLLVFFFFSALLINAQKPKVVLNHIAVYVTDLSKSTIFYQTIIGLDTIRNLCMMENTPGLKWRNIVIYTLYKVPLVHRHL